MTHLFRSAFNLFRLSDIAYLLAVSRSKFNMEAISMSVNPTSASTPVRAKIHVIK